jgi:UDP-N-acetylmuramate--alanine ligase
MSHYHLIGIGGTGLSAIARVLYERGHEVSGSDLLLSPLAQELRDMGVKVSIGHLAEQVEGADTVIRSSAIPDSNVEVAAALKAGIPVLKRIDFLKELTAGQKVIAVAGTHGKTTTTAMIAWCLQSLGLDPSYVIGSPAKNLDSNAHAGQGDYFVIEADEYDHMFLGLTPDILVVTNIEHDHPDCYPTPEIYFQAFLDLSELITSNGKLITCADHPGSARLMRSVREDLKTLAYGTQPDVDYRISHISHAPGCGVSFDLQFSTESGKPRSFKRIQLEIPGDHNACNAAAALAAVNESGHSVEQAIEALKAFSGTGRRFDILGEFKGITIINDYAHHPTEIRSTLSAARCRYPDRNIWAIWQPHTYSRTRELMQDFINAFPDCDHVIVTEIYASREKPEDFSSREIVERMQHPDARQIPALKDVTRYLVDNLQSGDVLLVLSAGDADQISHDVMAYLKGGSQQPND